MNSTGSLGNDDLLFGDDPFISGATSSQDNFNLFNDIYGDTLCDSESVYNDDLDRDVDFGSLGGVGFNAFLFTNSIPGGSSIDYDQFLNFDFGKSDDAAVLVDKHVETTNAEPAQKTNNVNHLKVQSKEGPQGMSGNVGKVLEYATTVVSKIKTTETVNNSKKDFVFTKEVSDKSELEHQIDYNPEALPKNQNVPTTVREGTGKIKYVFSSANKGRPIPYAVPTTSDTKQKILFPVKVLPTARNIRTKQHRNEQTIYAPRKYKPRPSVQPRFRVLVTQPPAEVVNENVTEHVDKMSNQKDERDLDDISEPKPAEVAKPTRKVMSALVPRDKASNHIKCSMCSCSFSTKLALEFHEVEKHSRVYAFRCTMCKDIFASLKCASIHIASQHNAQVVPMYDNSILGNSADFQDKRSYQRRISGMIFSFLTKHLTKLGLMSGVSQTDYAAVKEYSKKLYRPMQPPFKSTFGDEPETISPEAVEVANLNDMLKREFIYGPSVYRVPVESVNQNMIIYSHDEEQQNYVEEEGEIEESEELNFMPVVTQPVSIQKVVPKKANVLRYPIQQQQLSKQEAQPSSSNFRYTLNSVPMRNTYKPTEEENILFSFNKEVYGTAGRQKLYKVRTIARKVPVNKCVVESSSPSSYYTCQ